MNRSRLQIAKTDIIKYFDSLERPVLKLRQVQSILTAERRFWRLAQSTTATDFIAFLGQQGKLHTFDFPFPQRGETLYVWGDVSQMTILLGLRKKAYFSHFTAMSMLGLTEQTPTSMYITDERSQGTTQSVDKLLMQSDIDEAFKRPARVSQNAAVLGPRKIYLLNGAHTGHLGVVQERVNDNDGREVEVRLTNVERTLIDISVRPFYAGGIHEVAKAFTLARDQISVNKLVTTLRKLEFAYPYHQAIGYYLERAGYKSSLLDLVRRLPMNHDFYLAHEMGATRYVSEWRLFVPEGF